MSAKVERSEIYRANRPRLNSLGDRTMINRAPLNDLVRLVTEAQAGHTTANEVLAYLGSRYQRPDFVSPFGLDWHRTQGATCWETLEGNDRAQALELSRQIDAQHQAIRAAVGAPDLHILKRSVITQQLEPLPYQSTLDNQNESLIDRYLGAWHQFLDYFEGLFSPADVIEYCEQKITQNEVYLAGGVNVRIGQALSEAEIVAVQSMIVGYQEAIERNKKRKQA